MKKFFVMKDAVNSKSATQGAVEVWDYSAHHMQSYLETPVFRQSSIIFRHVPFSWFPVVRAEHTGKLHFPHSWLLN